MDKQDAIRQAIENMLAQAGAGHAPLALDKQLKIERQRDIERITKRETARRQALEAATWLCAHCGQVHEPKVFRSCDVCGLVKNQADLSYSEPMWLCSECEARPGEQKLRGNHPQVYNAVKIEFCACSQAQAERQAAAEAERQIAERRFLACLETQELWQSFDTEWPDDETARRELRQAKQKILEWYMARSGRGLLLAGSYGSGKSHLLRAVIRAYGIQGIPVKFVTEPDILSVLTNRAEANEVLLMKNCRQAEILVIDDIGAEEFDSHSLWARNLLQSFYFRILEHRAGGDLATLFSTNFDRDDLSAKLGPRAIDRLFHIIDSRSNIVYLWNVPSYRMRKFDF